MRRLSRCLASASAGVAALALSAHAAAEDMKDMPGMSSGHAAVAPVYDARFDPPAPGSYELPPIQTLSPHTLRAPGGEAQPVWQEDGLTFVSWIYLHCPGACPAATALMQRVDRAVTANPELRERVALTTVSFDPARDTPAAMGALAERVRPKGRWRFLTAPDEATLEPVLADFGQDRLPAVADAAPGTLHHVLKVFLVDGGGAIRMVYSTGFLDPRVLVNDALTVLAETASP